MRTVNLSNAQKSVVEFGEGPLLVQAAAGSGKTRVLTERICTLAQKTRRKILAITFTNQASEEIRNRLSEIDENLLEKVFIGTFHSFCNMVLENHGSSIGLMEMPQVFSDNQDRLQIIEKAIQNTPSIRSKYITLAEKERNNLKYRALEAISIIKREGVLDEELDSFLGDNHEDLKLVYFEYRDDLAALNAVDFDDLLWLTYKLFVTNHNLAKLYSRNYEFVCVDEAQDLNKVQYLVLRSMTLGRNSNIMLVGDPNQSIYGFNGSSARLMQKDFVDDYSPQIISLHENYRSTKAVLSLANKIIPNSASLDNIVLEGVCEQVAYNNVEDEAKSVCTTIMNYVKKGNLKDIEGPVTFSNFAILARNKYVLKNVEEILVANNIPYFYKTTSSEIEFNSISGKILFIGLLVKTNPKDTFHFSKLKELLKIKNGSNSLEELLSDLAEGSLRHCLIETLVNIQTDGSNFRKCINELIQNIQSQSLTDSEDELNNAFEDFKDLLNHWHRFSVKQADHSIASFRNAVSLGQTSIKREETGVALSTVHTMKGQEKDIVFLIGMDDQTFPDYRAIDKGGFEMLQEKNNLYVAVTRARRYLFISYPKERIMPWGAVRTRQRSRLLPN